MVHKKNYSLKTYRFGAGLELSRWNIPFSPENSRRKMAGNMGVRAARSRLVKDGKLGGQASIGQSQRSTKVGGFTHGRLFTWAVLAHVYFGGDRVYTWAV